MDRRGGFCSCDGLVVSLRKGVSLHLVRPLNWGDFTEECFVVGHVSLLIDWADHFGSGDECGAHGDLWVPVVAAVAGLSVRTDHAAVGRDVFFGGREHGYRGICPGGSPELA